MVWAIVVVAIGILGVAAWAGTGRLGEMPGAVNDRPKPHVPDGPVDEAFLTNLSLPIAGTGYRCSQVDALLAAHVAGEDIEPGTRFDVVRKGYDMQAVDAVIDRISVFEYPGRGPATDDGVGVIAERDEVGDMEEEALESSRADQRPLSQAYSKHERGGESATRATNSECLEERKRAVEGDWSAPVTDDAG